MQILDMLHCMNMETMDGLRLAELQLPAFSYCSFACKTLAA
ncbi:hypothetical protein BDE02_13G013300 [Populus trichocarpa]|nr:hypothetical protein BDE02_13G013300 [Populus trichocarpa]